MASKPVYVFQVNVYTDNSLCIYISTDMCEERSIIVALGFCEHIALIGGLVPDAYLYLDPA